MVIFATVRRQFYDWRSLLKDLATTIEDKVVMGMPEVKKAARGGGALRSVLMSVRMSDADLNLDPLRTRKRSP